LIGFFNFLILFDQLASSARGQLTDRTPEGLADPGALARVIY
jgi:hypothetical protein